MNRSSESIEQFNYYKAMNPKHFPLLPEERSKVRRKFRKDATPTEGIMWSRLRNRQLGVKFRRQHPIDSYILDFYCPELRLAIEIDGDVHALPDQIVKDALREQHLRTQEITVFRVTNNEVRTNLNGALEKILALTLTLSQREREEKGSV